MLPGLPPEMLKMEKEMGLDDFSETKPNQYEPWNKARKNRSRKKLRKRQMVSASRRKNRR